MQTPWDVEGTDPFRDWGMGLAENQRGAVTPRVERLSERGPSLPYPYSSDFGDSRHGGMRELRAQAGGHPLGVFSAFEPWHMVILLIGGGKAGNDPFFEASIPRAY